MPKNAGGNRGEEQVDQMPRYGEVWRVDPGEESQGTGWLGLVVSTDAIGPMPWRIIAQIEEEGKPIGIWQVPAPTNPDSGLQRGAWVDTGRLCTVEQKRWGERVGRVPADVMAEVAAAIAILVEFEE